MIASWGSYTFLFYAALDVIMSILVFFFLKETKGRSLEEMETIFNSRAQFDVLAARQKALGKDTEELVHGDTKVQYSPANFSG